ncbi:pyrroline-5-carboxylate reductase family protein, partial [Streptococcus suis]
VTSPGGSTIAGVVALEKEGFLYAIIKAVAAALKKTRKLGKKYKTAKNGTFNPVLFFP